MRMASHLRLPVLTLSLVACAGGAGGDAGGSAAGNATGNGTTDPGGGSGGAIVNTAPTISSAAALSLPENSRAVQTIVATDVDGDALSFALSAGVDRGLFAIDGSSGALSFVTAPDYEDPGDSDGDNVYELTVQVSDGSLSSSQALTVQVTDVGEGFWPAVIRLPSTLDRFPDDGAYSQGDQQGIYADGQPLRSVVVSQSFEMAQTEVTNQQYCDMLNWALDQALITASSSTVSNAGGTAKELLDLDAPFCQIAYDGSAFSVKTISGLPADETSRASHPVVEVSWYGSQFFCWAQNQQAGMAADDQPIVLGDGSSDWSVDIRKAGWRLPTEAEWEYAARGGWDGGAKYPWWTASGPNGEPRAGDGNFWGQHAGYGSAGFPRTTPAGFGAFAGNGFALRDMAGNVGEWCSDWYGDDADPVQTDPAGPARGTYRVRRGGSWGNSAFFQRCAYRSWRAPSDGSVVLGFRPLCAQAKPTADN